MPLGLSPPRMDVRDPLSIINKDPNLKHIPVVVLTVSQAKQVIAKSYDKNANCYVTKNGKP